MPVSVQDIVDDAKNCLRQWSELYGRELILNRTDVLKAVPAALQSTQSLNAFFKKIEHCCSCALGKTRNRFVFGAGSPDAELMLIGEAPGRDEDMQGEPFVGKAGQLLDKILAAIGFKREEVFIGNILKCRPPQNRDPLPEEVERCLPHLLTQIELIRPKLILTLGRISAQVLLETDEPMGRLRGRVHAFKDIPLIATYHPAALLRNPSWKRSVWEDVQRLRVLYDERVGDKPKWQPRKK